MDHAAISVNRLVALASLVSLFLATPCESSTEPLPLPLSDPALEEAREVLPDLLRTQRNAEADSITSAVVARMEETYGRRSVPTARALELWANAHSVHRPRDHLALEAAEEALEIKGALLDPSDPLIATALYTLGLVEWRRGESVSALPRMERALALQEAAEPQDELAVANTLNGLAILYGTLEDGAKAEELLRRNLAIQERHRGPEHPTTMMVLGNLGWALGIQGKWDQSLEIDEEVLRRREIALGPEHPDVAKSLNDIGLAYWRLGELATARARLQRSLEIDEHVLPPGDVALARPLNNLAIVHRAIGDFRGAIDLYERALRIREDTNGPEHPLTAIVWHNLGHVFGDAGRWEEGRACHERALRIRRASLGPRHHLVASSLSELSEAEWHVGALDSADVHSAQSVEIFEAEAPERPERAYALLRRAQILDTAGDHEAARRHFEEGVAFREGVLGPEHRETTEAKVQLARFLLQRGEWELALEVALAAEGAARRYARLMAQTLPERQALSLVAVRPTAIPDLLDHLGEAPPGESLARVWDVVIRSRSLVLDEMGERRRAAARTPANVSDVADSLASARGELADLVVGGPDGDPAESYVENVRALRDREERWEKELAQASPTFRAAQERRRIGEPEVRSALEEGDVLVAYVRWESPEGETASYGAFVVGFGSEPTFVPLGSAATVEALVAEWRRAVREPSGFSIRRGRTRYRQVGEALRECIWDPIAPLASGAGRVLLVPDGELHVVNLETLPAAAPDSETRPDLVFLLETLPPLRLGSTERDLVPVDRVEMPDRRLAVGGVDFDAWPDASETSPALASAPRGDAGHLFRRAHTNCRTFSDLAFPALPSTGVEAAAVADSWRSSSGVDGAPLAKEVILLTEARGREEEFKRLAPGCRMIHVATHGFFLGDACPTRYRDGGRSTLDDVLLVLHENPLLRSGLALAGANRRGLTGPDDDDGILTAEEIATLRLETVELAVLSACDTGTDEVRAGEDVFGLRRAFRVAGARTLVFSLWPVRDEAARLWVEGFYESLGAGSTPASAARSSSLRQLRARRETGRDPHPRSWGAFVVSGH